MAIDVLAGFADWFLRKSPKFGLIQSQEAVTYIEDVTAVLWYRDGQFQVQQFIVPPNYIIPAHTHPNVDSFELYLGGNIEFSKNGEFVISEDDSQKVDEHGSAYMRLEMLRIYPNDLHGGKFGPNGGVFMSIQHWLNGVAPHCVSADYTGTVMGPDHYNKVKHGTAILTNQSDLSKNDAAVDWEERKAVKIGTILQSYGHTQRDETREQRDGWNCT